MAERRVVITGLGSITPIGIGGAAMWDGLRSRRSAVQPITRFDPSPFKSRIAAQVNDFFARDHVEERRARRLDRFGQFSVAAARLALSDAELELDREDRERKEPEGLVEPRRLGDQREGHDRERERREEHRRPRERLAPGQAA